MTILAVDGDRVALAALADTLRRLAPSDEVRAFPDGEKAVAYAAAHPADVVFTEIQLPRISGFTLVEKLRKQRPTVYIVFVTALPNFALDAFGVNANGYLLKPAADEKLAAKLEQARFYGA